MDDEERIRACCGAQAVAEEGVHREDSVREWINGAPKGFFQEGEQSYDGVGIGANGRVQQERRDDR